MLISRSEYWALGITVRLSVLSSKELKGSETIWLQLTYDILLQKIDNQDIFFMTYLWIYINSTVWRFKYPPTPNSYEENILVFNSLQKHVQVFLYSDHFSGEVWPNRLGPLV